jgi:hypothetical protein
MTLDEFGKWLEKQPLRSKLVSMRYKYSHEDKWEYSNEYLEVDTSVDGNYAWLNDWNEGQEDVEILGAISIDSIKVPGFVMTNYENLKQMDSDELAVTICDMMGVCDKCPAGNMCMMGNGKANGLKEWMKQEVEE